LILRLLKSSEKISRLAVKEDPELMEKKEEKENLESKKNRRKLLRKKPRTKRLPSRRRLLTRVLPSVSPEGDKDLARDNSDCILR
jgi:hypothetical protein